jgi:hypothetical protein
MLLECHGTCFSHISIMLLYVLLYPLLRQSHCPKLKEPSCLLVKEPTIDFPFVINMHMYKILMCTALYPCMNNCPRLDFLQNGHWTVPIRQQCPDLNCV